MKNVGPGHEIFRQIPKLRSVDRAEPKNHLYLAFVAFPPYRSIKVRWQEWKRNRLSYLRRCTSFAKIYKVVSLKTVKISPCFDRPIPNVSWSYRCPLMWMNIWNRWLCPFICTWKLTIAFFKSLMNLRISCC